MTVKSEWGVTASPPPGRGRSSSTPNFDRHASNKKAHLVRSKSLCKDQVSLNKHAEKEAAGQQAASYVQNGRTSADMLTPPGGPPGYNYQVFKVCEERCIVLTVTIVKGMGITRGKIKDWLYSPDPYVTAQVLGTPNGLKRTQHIPNNPDPEWNEDLKFYIDPERDRIIEFVLYDLNRTVNEEIGREIFDFHGYAQDTPHSIVISYKNGSKIEVKLLLEQNKTSDLKFGLELCDDEKAYLKKRQPKIMTGLAAFMDDPEDVPKNNAECPKICLMTSGGGFRAMIANCGAYKAMEDVGLIDCLTYISALSGSSWYLSTLYSHPDFTNKPHLSHKIKEEIRSCVEKHWQVHLSPPWSSKYLRKIITKSVNGQPVSFTDFYGYLVGQQLLKGRMKARLSDQRNKISDGQAPMPMYTCLHVKSNVSAKVFQEWYEFTPFEVGIPKYGSTMKAEDFACKFYMGQKVKSFPEVRLHFLYGIWGSAFTILFKRLVQEKGRNGQSEILKMVMGGDDNPGLNPNRKSADNDDIDDEELIVRCLAQECEKEAAKVVKQNKRDEENNSNSDEGIVADKSGLDLDLDDEEIMFCDPITSDTEEDIFYDVQEDFPESNDNEEEEEDEYISIKVREKSPDDSSHLKEKSPEELRRRRTKSETSKSDIASTDDELKEEYDLAPDAAKIMSTSNPRKSNKMTFRQRMRQYSLPKLNIPKRGQNQKATGTGSLPSSDGLSSGFESSPDVLQIPSQKSDKVSPTPSERIQAIEEERSRWDRVLERALTTTPLDSRAFRAGVILNPLRGLTVTETKQPSETLHQLKSPVKSTDRDDNDFKGYRESMKTDDKKIYLVDSGLSFNLPFPLTLRPQRGIELYITCDFSSRVSDSTPPFRELLLAEKWAVLHNIPFPPVKEMAKEFLDEPIRECYVFKDEGNPDIPVVIFFPMVNRDFRHFKAPGVERESEEEKAFGNFPIFDNTNAYAIWRFVYPNLSFDRMTAMMEFNVLNNLHIVKSEIAQIVHRKRKSNEGCPP